MAKWLERALGEKEREIFPADNTTVLANPPPFGWVEFEGVSAWMVELVDSKGGKSTYGPLRDPILAPPKRLKPGNWSWQYVGLDRDGQEVGRGKPRHFEVPADVSGACIPTARQLLKKLGRHRPRFLDQRIQNARQTLNQGGNQAFKDLTQWCRIAEKDEFFREPARHRPFHEDAQEYYEDWVRIFDAAKVGTANASRFALSYLLTDNERHLHLARRWALHMAAWDPFGTTSAFYNDESSMPLLERLSWVYDWLWDHWTDDERTAYLDCMRARGQEVYLKYRRIHFSSKPFNNHMCRQLGFLGTAGLVFLGEIPEAETWLDYVLQVLATRYPGASWGSQDGGWSNGLSYWASYLLFLVTFLTGIGDHGVDFFDTPYFRNTGYQALYHLPPYAPAGGFGDWAIALPDSNPDMTIGRLLLLTVNANIGNPDIKAYTDALPPPRVRPAQRAKSPDYDTLSDRRDAWQVPELLSILLDQPRRQIEASDLTKLPSSRMVDSIGWASMHTALGNAAKDAWVEFKSGPFGSVSHSHGDQNSFNLNAFGKALLIDTGYYSWYGSPHDTLWTRQTWAHNAMLIGNHGQPCFDWFARGKIEAFAELGAFAYARGEAAQAYNRGPMPLMLEVAEHNMPEIIQRFGPATAVQRASRSMMMVNGKTPFFVVTDWIETEDAVRHQWLGHALHEMEIKNEWPGFVVRNDPAWLAVHFALPDKLEFSQTDEFAPPPDGRAIGFPNQWHLTAQTTKTAKSARFAAIMIPGKGKQAQPAVETTQKAGTLIVSVGDAVVLLPSKGVTGTMKHGELEADAAAVVRIGGTGEGKSGEGWKLHVAEATRVRYAGRLLYEGAPVSCELTV